MTCKDTKSEQNPSILCLLEEFKNIGSATGSIPTLTQLEEHGAYSVDEFRAAFGSHDALVEAAQQPRNQVLLAIRQERSKRGHTPKLSEVRESGQENVSDVWKHFDTWTEALEVAEVLPTADAIIEEIQKENAKLGQIPNAGDFLDRTRYRQVDYLHHFESWDDALLAAGFDVNEDELYSEIHRITDEVEQTPTLAEFEKTAPSAYELYQRSDRSWMETLDDAGVLPSKDHIIREINDLAGEMDRLPNAGEFTDRTNIRGAVYQYHFGNWITALGDAGLLPTKTELMDHIRGLSDELESIPVQSNFLEKSKYSKSVYDYYFESWEEAIAAAGLLPSKEELAGQIRAVSEATGSIPNRDAVVEQGDYSGQAYEFQFSNWEEALETADVLPSQAEFLSLVRSAGTGTGWVDQDAVYGKDALPSEYHTQFFDSWEATLDAAGVLPSEEELLSLLRGADGTTWWLDKYEFYQTTNLPNDYHTRFFDSWAEALEAAGVAPTKKEFLSMLRDAKANNGWIDQQRFYAETDLPNKYHKRFFDSWAKSLDSAGVLPSKEELLQHLRELGTKLGPIPSHSDIIKEGKYQGTIYCSVE